MRRDGVATRLRLPARRGWSVRARLGAVSTIVATIGLSVAGSTAYVVTSRTLHQQIDESLRSAPMRIGDSAPVNVPSKSSFCRALNSSQGASPGLFTVQLISADGSTCADPTDSQVQLTDADFEAARTGDVDLLRDGRLQNGHSARVGVVSIDDGSALVIARDTESVANVLDTLVATLLGVILVGALTALLLSRWTSGAGLRPITQFAQVAENIAVTGNLEHPVPLQTLHVGGAKDELSRLAHAFTTMTTVLADAQMRQRRLVADAGHELRTPLSSLRANIALLRRARAFGRPLPTEEEGRLLEDVEEQVIELSQLVGDLSELASSDADSRVFESIRLDEVVERAVERARRRAVGHDFSIQLDPWLVNGDAGSLERAVVNLLDNAVKFSPRHTTITVALEAGVVSIADEGPGVSPEESRRAFERFWRSPRARSLPGGGLGLSIVHDVAERHGGYAHLDNCELGGAVATLYLPGRPSIQSPV